MDEDMYLGRDHEDSLGLVQIARAELVEAQKELDVRRSEIFRATSRLRSEMPTPPRYDSFYVTVSEKGIGYRGVYSDAIKRSEDERARREASERKRRWGDVKRDYDETCQRISDRIEALNAEELVLIAKVRAAKECLREFTRELFQFNPSPSSLARISSEQFGGGMLWRGTLMRRVAVTRQTDSMARVEAIRDGLHGEAYDFTPHFEVALRYARGGSGNDSISGADRTDPVVIGFQAPSNSRHIQPAYEGEPGNVIVHEELLMGRWIILGSAAPSEAAPE